MSFFFFILPDAGIALKIRTYSIKKEAGFKYNYFCGERYGGTKKNNGCAGDP
jgi:hypothetical protein